MGCSSCCAGVLNECRFDLVYATTSADGSVRYHYETFREEIIPGLIPKFASHSLCSTTDSACYLPQGREPFFTITATVRGLEFRGSGRSKKQAKRKLLGPQ